MAISTTSVPQPFRYQAISSAGTYTLSASIAPGTWRVTTDTTQNITAAFLDSNGVRYNFAVRGGVGYASIPFTATQILVPAGATYPILIGWELVTASTQIAAPSSASSAWSSRTVGTVSFSLPSGATSASLVNKLGTVIPLGSTSPVTLTQGTNTQALISPDSLFGVVVGIDAFGANGNGTVVNTTSTFLAAPTNITFAWSSGGGNGVLTYTPAPSSAGARIEWSTGEFTTLSNTGSDSVFIATSIVAEGATKSYVLSSRTAGNVWGHISASATTPTRPTIVPVTTDYTSSGNFVTPASVNSLEVLVVGGGGSAGGRIGGGGGAGGVQYASALSVTGGTTYSVVIGAGGAAAGGDINGNDGASSSFGTNLMIANGGGGGGGFSNSNSTVGLGRNGGSGGGGCFGGSPNSNKAGGNAVAGTGGTFSGNVGGTSTGNTPAGQGGGAGNAGGGTGGGGNGITVAGVTVGGGGGAGSAATGVAGGSGGGGTGTTAPGTQGTDGTGGGGGGGSSQNSGGRGGNGFVRVRYIG